MENKNFSDLIKEDYKKILTALITVLTLFLIVITISLAVGIKNKIKEGKYIGQEIETKNTISVSDTGEIFVKPDLALVNFSVVTEAKTVAKALSDNTQKTNNAIAFIKNQGVVEKDLKTANFNIYPRYEYSDNGRRSLAGYEVYQSLEVKIRDLEKIGAIIGGVADSGVNQVGDLQFTIDNQDEFKKQARNQAIREAKLKAEELAKELGVDLVRISNFSESGAVPPVFYSLQKAEFGIGGGGEAPQIQTGENKIEVTVTITYEIN